MTSTRSKGYAAERLVMDYLKDKGYQILTHNFYCYHGEIDIIARKHDDIYFVEVKSTSSNYIDPLFKINQTKKKRLQKSALYYMSITNCYDQMHFDLITVTNNKLTHYKDIICFS